MVGIVVVSHSARLADGVIELAREMGGPDVRLEAAGGTDDPDAPLGTDATKVLAAIEAADTGDGVLVLMDLGSGVLSAEMALDLLGGEPYRRVVLSEAPLVEGAVSAAIAAKLGASLDDVASEARGALAPKAAHLSGDAVEGDGAAAPAAPEASGIDATAELDVTNKLGLHARPAARFVTAAGSFEAEVRVTNLTTGEGPVNARSINAVATLGVRQGHRIRVDARGPQATEVVDALSSLAAENWGDRADSVPSPELPERTGEAPAGAIGGVAASPGVAIGPLRHLRPVAVSIPDEAAADPNSEWERLLTALETSKSQINEMRAAAAERLGGSEVEIFDAHLLLLDDDELLNIARGAVHDDGRPAARAWSDAVNSIARRYEELDDAYQAERAADVRDVGNRVLANLLGVAPARTVDGSGVLAVTELTPTDATTLDPQVTKGIVTARGGPTSHGAILARSLGIPAVVGAGDRVIEIAKGTTVALDGAAGVVFVDPSKKVLEEFAARRDREAALQLQRRRAAAAPAVTADGTRIDVYANIGRPEDADAAVAAGADGVGLLRTEFLFLDRDQPPSEDEQYAVYCDVAARLGGRPLIVRTLDAGADKPIPFVPASPEANPFLGVRGIRLSLAHEELLETQLRAVLRAAADHPLKVMFPMIATATELRGAVAVVERARAGLRDGGVDVPARVEIGIMVEVPAAALTSELFAREVSFFSIGTNDLAQYTLAAERGNERVAALADPLHPAVLRLIDRVVQAAREHGRWVAVCGEIAGDALAAPVLVGLGVTELSMAAAAIPTVKHVLRSIDLGDARDLARAALNADSAPAVRELAGGWERPR
jgi:phosphoenolpyruvate-protein phosphotransferase/dihydroxyacetone kinase phosphotransfer subunit